MVFMGGALSGANYGEKIMARTLVYVESGKPVQLGDVHRFAGWNVTVVGMEDVASRYEGATETFSDGSVTISYLQGASHQHSTFACNIGAQWIDA